MRKNLVVLFLIFTFVFPYSLAAQTVTKKGSVAMKAMETIQAKQMSDYLYFIASDEMEGRNTPSRGLNTTAKFIAMNLSRWGFKPAGDDGTYFQKIALKRNPMPAATPSATPTPAASPAPGTPQPPRRPRPFTLNLDEKYNPATMNGDDYVMTQNVVAIWEGSDPSLKAEMVAVGAHYDHIGNDPTQGCRAITGDSLCNGADDDGSGTTAVLAIAEALAKAPKRPKRSILLVWHCGEEKGLWGSRYFTKYPTVDLKNVIAQLNIDMIGRSRKAGDTNPKNKDLSGENAIYVIGSQMMSSQLGKTVADINNSYLKLNYDLRYDDPKDTNRFFFRSDHFNYAQKGIPITFWFDGVHEDYHQPGDEPQKIDYNKMQMIARTIFLTMWELADTKERPKIDKQLPAELTEK